MRTDIKDRIEQIKKGQVPQGYKKTKVGIFPIDWKEYRIKDILKEVTRQVKMENDNEYNLVTVKRRFGGIISRGKYLGKSILVKSQFLLKEGDFLISKRQISHGACEIVPKELEGSIVSNEYNVLNPKKELLDINFLSKYIQLRKIKRYFYFSSDGVHIEKLLFKLNSWFKRKVYIPLKEEQTQIASILLTWDTAIEKQEKLIELKKEQKKWLMQELLTGKNRLKGFSGEWKEVRIKNILSYERPDKFITNDFEKERGNGIPVLTANKAFVLGYTDNIENVYKNIPVILFDDFTTDNKYVDFEFSVRSSAIKILKIKSKEFDIKFIYEKMQIIKFPLGEHKRYYISEYQYLKTNVPKLQEQKAIAEILSTVDKEIDFLEKELEAIQEQKKGLMQLLLTGIVRVRQIPSPPAPLPEKERGGKVFPSPF